MRAESDDQRDFNDRQAIDGRIAALMELYGDGAGGSSPTAPQWRSLVGGDLARPITLINFFKIRAVAQYDVREGAPDPPGSGGQAMMRYAAVSGQTLEKVGGRFLLTAPYEGAFIGQDEEWDMVAIGTYPSVNALLALFEDEEYVVAFRHRRASVERQRVVAVAG